MKVIKDDFLEKEKFQLDRIAFFSDAIFAIAITLLIIEIKVPEVDSKNLSDRTLFIASTYLIPKFIGFTVSFFVIGLYWLAHHRMFKYIVRSSQKLLWNNLIFMFPIVIMPFSTAFLSDYFNGALQMPLIVYTINICMA
ncbi:MAG: TMEM175 family protein, partial [Ginsengibacter sp.]